MKWLRLAQHRAKKTPLAIAPVVLPAPRHYHACGYAYAGLNKGKPIEPVGFCNLATNDLDLLRTHVMRSFQRPLLEFERVEECANPSECPGGKA